ncbi:venom metalloproteinase antarease-like TpachMP_B isoform X2 [Dermacentor silvarum]|uniref:venom metalloproteinase antarease-like TpachMP_B isoform X2 n=1 Tax=Dermacentor silvarum TaxID=543639 RepID=UPI0021007B60|nr:venom metalloproteinase antarease-like TpachMP_B isoform X2 [Dermacentor silvarum]
MCSPWGLGCRKEIVSPSRTLRSMFFAAMLLTMPVAYLLYGVLNITHEIEPVGNKEEMTLESASHRIIKSKTVNRPPRIPGFAEPRSADQPEGNQSSLSFVAEAYVIVDSELTKRVQRKGKTVQQYVTEFMASVSRVLQTLEPPGSIVVTTIQINNAGAEEHLVFTNGNYVDSQKTLAKLVIQATSNSKWQHVDMIIMLIGREMVQVGPNGHNLVSYGAAFTGTVCTPRNVMVVADNGKKFAGVMSAVHEIGHLLGSPHDGGPWSSECAPSVGYIMSPSAEGDIRLEFSDCSKRAIRSFVTNHATCLFVQNNMPNATDADAAISKVDTKHQKESKRKCSVYLQQGEYLLRAEQKDKNYPKCNVICTAVSRSSSRERVFAVVAPDGIPCNKSDLSKVCKRGRCKHVKN